MSHTIELTSGAAINTARFVKGDSTDNRVVNADAASIPVGISQEGSQDNPFVAGDVTQATTAAGQQLEVFPYGSEARLTAGSGGLTRFVPAKPDANGKGIAATTGDVAGFIPFESAAEGELCKGLVISPYNVV